MAVKRRSKWWRQHALSRILHCLPPDKRAEAKEVLNALDPDNPVAALCWLIDSHKVEVMAIAEAKRRAEA